MAAVVLVVSLIALARTAGGYFPAPHLVAGAIAFTVAGVILLVAPPRQRLSTNSLAALPALGLFAAWSGLSAAWSSSPWTALEDMNRDLVYVGLFLLALLAAGSGRPAKWLTWALRGAAIAVVALGVGSRLFPELISESSTATALTGYRLGHPLGYWNAFGALAAMALVMATGLAGDRRSPLPLRGLAAAAAPVAATAVYLSFSRGAWVALAVGMAALVAVAPRRATLMASVGIIAVAAVVLVLRLEALPALTENPRAGAGQEAAGRSFAVLLVLVCVAAGAAQVAFLTWWRRVRLDRSLHRPTLHGPGRRRIAAVAGVVVVGLLLGYAAFGDSLEAKTVDAADFVSQQWSDFTHPTVYDVSGSERLTSARGSRSDLYRVAIDGFQANPLAGEGGGSFEYRWARERRVGEKVRDAHSLELETLAELGLIGLALLLAFLGAVGRAAWRGRRRPAALSRTQTAAVIAALVVWVVHSAVDWDWQMPAVTGLALALAAVLCASEPRRHSGSRSASRRSVFATEGAA